ncbi:MULTISPECIES: hypothetical protein [Arthrobacter]|uniref:Uncharacterized protein n=2 Tax=Arthrobacter TaxID=1663 RepID=A0ABU9KFR9_9MICC|nr:hypothetical protein [Arthrobacter sp. YJM1]MDP5225730.1 hypothetical protein [Arthrobacter sp. YJM1]
MSDQQQYGTAPWQRQTATWPPQAPGLSPADAERSRRHRTMIGVVLLVFAAFALFAAGLQALLLNKGTLDEDTSLEVLITAVGYVVEALLYTGFGIWNLAARKGTARGPLIGAIVIAGLALIMIGINAIQAAGLHGSVSIAGLGFNVLVISRAVIALRLKPMPAQQLH